MEKLADPCRECVPGLIDNQFFACYPEFPSYVTYRARIEGTSERNSSSLISLIEEWVRGGGASIIVNGVLLTIDPTCSVVISSFGDPECSTSSSSPQSSATVSISAMFSGIVTATLASAVVTAGVMFLIFFLLRKPWKQR